MPGKNANNSICVRFSRSFIFSAILYLLQCTKKPQRKYFGCKDSVILFIHAFLIFLVPYFLQLVQCGFCKKCVKISKVKMFCANNGRHFFASYCLEFAILSFRLALVRYYYHQKISYCNFAMSQNCEHEIMPTA